MSKSNTDSFSFSIRKAQSKDMDYLYLLIDQLGYFLSKEEIHYNLQFYLTQPDYTVFVAEYQAQVVGCIAIHIMRVFHTTGQMARIVTLVTDHNFRRKGIASQLVTEAENYAKYMNCESIELTSGQHRKSLGSHDFYYKVGYADPLKLYLRKPL